MTSQTVKTLRDLKKDKPGAANNRRKYLSSMFGWAIEQTPPLMKVNPARDVRRIRYESEGFHTWTADEFEQFEKRHPLGTKAHLALALLLYTGTRRGDMVTLGRQHVKDGWLRFVPGKSRKQTKKAVLSEKPWLPVLDQIVKASPCGDLTFLVTEYGKPFTAAGFGNWFRDRCTRLNFPNAVPTGCARWEQHVRPRKVRPNTNSWRFRLAHARTGSRLHGAGAQEEARRLGDDTAG
jgi:integrase